MSALIDRTGWQRVRFGDLIANVNDRVDDPSAAGVDRYVGLEHLDPGSMTVTRWGSPDEVEAQKLRFKRGDVIFGRRRAYQRKVAQADFEGICSAHALVLRAKPGLIKPEFLPVFLSSDTFLDRAIKISVGSLSPTVNWGTLAVQEFDLPPLDQQRRIADLLWAVEAQRKSLKDLRDALTSLLETNVGASMEAVRQEFGETPLAELAAVTSGITLGPARSTLPLRKPYLRVANLQRGRLDLTEIKQTGVTPDEALAKSLHRGDVLVVEGHASVSEIGRAAVWQGDGSMLFQNHLFRLRAGPEAKGEYLELAINSSYGRMYMTTVAKSTSGLHTINSRVLRKMPIPAAPLHRQLEVLDQVRAVAAAQTRVASEQATLDKLKAALMEALLGSAL